MLHNGARAISTIPHLFVAAWLIFAFTAETAYSDPFSKERPYTNGQSTDIKSRNRIQCNGLEISSSICSKKFELLHNEQAYIRVPTHEEFWTAQGSSNQSRADLVTVFLLALEEFNFLSGLRFYWNYAENYIDELSTKLKLKGEISISDSYDHSREEARGRSRYLKRSTARTSTDSANLRSLFTPQTIRWKLGINPDDLSVFMDLHLNSHLSFSSEFGDESKVGLYFKYNF